MDSDDFGVDSDGDDADDDGVDISAKQRRKLIGSFHRLKTWYKNQYPTEVRPPTTPKKSGKKKVEAEPSEQPPLIVVLEDFEAFSAAILQKFIQNIRFVTVSSEQDNLFLPFLLNF